MRPGLRVLLTAALLFAAPAIPLATAPVAGAASAVATAPVLAPDEGASLALGDLGPLDLGDLDAVFAAVFAALPSEMTVLPSENYQYIRFESGGREMRGNLRLSVLDRDEGVLHFAYYEHRAPGAAPASLDAHHRPLGVADGLVLERVGASAYDATFAGKTVGFRLHELDQSPPRLWTPGPEETVVFRTYDESHVGFFLLFDGANDRFLWILDEENGALPLEPVTGAPDVLLDPRTGFAFVEDGARKVLVAVRATNVRANTYYDGPFDQLADNDITDASLLRAFIERAYPGVAGRIDAYGHFTDREGARVAITPYAQWTTQASLGDAASCVDALGTSAQDACVRSRNAVCVSGGHEHDGVISVQHSIQVSMSPVPGIWHDPFTTQGGCFPTGDDIGVCASPPEEHDGATSNWHVTWLSTPGTGFGPTASDLARALPIHEAEVTWLDHGAELSTLAGPSVIHDGETTRTCTDTLHLGPFSWAYGAPVCAAGVPADGGLPVWHDPETTRGCTDLPIHFGGESRLGQPACGTHHPANSMWEHFVWLSLFLPPDGTIWQEATRPCSEPTCDTLARMGVEVERCSLAPSHDHDVSAMLGTGGAIVHEEETSRGCTDHGFPPIRLCTAPPTHFDAISHARVSGPPGVPIATLYAEDFELGPEGWTTSGSGLWEHGTPTAHVHPANGILLWGTELSGSYPNHACARLESPPIALPAAATQGGLVSLATLRYDQWLHAERFYDGGVVEVSADGGSTWTRLTPRGGYDETMRAADVRACLGVGASDRVFSGPSALPAPDAWEEVEMDLTPYLGQTVVFRWTFASDRSITGLGWYIDDVRVELAARALLPCTVTLEGLGPSSTSCSPFVEPSGPLEWRDCNSDGYVGHGPLGLNPYRAELLLDVSLCPPGSPYNDGAWVRERG